MRIIDTKSSHSDQKFIDCFKKECGYQTSSDSRYILTFKDFKSIGLQ